MLHTDRYSCFSIARDQRRKDDVFLVKFASRAVEEWVPQSEETRVELWQVAWDPTIGAYSITYISISISYLLFSEYLHSE